MTGGVSRHAGNARFAAATAAPRSAAVDSGVRAIVSPVEGLWTSRNSVAAEAIQRPETKF